MKSLPFFLLCFACMSSCDEPAGEGTSIPQDAPPTTAVGGAGVPVPATTPLGSAMLPATTDYLPDTSRRLTKGSPPEKLTAREDLVTFARQFLGSPYVYAESDPEKGFDCSGFIYYVYQHFNISVPRSSIDFKKWGREVPLSQAKVADLILFTGADDTDRIGHIGIILQANSDTTAFLHASSGKEMAVTISSAASPHYRKRFVKVVDVISK